MFIAVCSLFSFSSLFFSPPDTNQQKHDPFPISITHRQTLSTFSFPCVIVQIHRPYGDEILGSVSPRSKFRIHSLEQIAGTNLQTLLRHSSLQSTLSLSLSHHIFFYNQQNNHRVSSFSSHFHFPSKFAVQYPQSPGRNPRLPPLPQRRSRQGTYNSQSHEKHSPFSLRSLILWKIADKCGYVVAAIAPCLFIGFIVLDLFVCVCVQSNSFVEGVSHKIRRQIEELERVSGVMSSGLTVDGVPVDSYLTRFVGLESNL